MSGDDKRIHIGGSLFVLLLLASLALRCNSDRSPNATIHTVEQYLQSNQVDADGVIVEICPAESISKETHPDDDCIVVTAGPTTVAIADGRLTVNAISHGSVDLGDFVLVDNNVVYINDKRRVPENEDQDRPDAALSPPEKRERNGSRKAPPIKTAVADNVTNQINSSRAVEIVRELTSKDLDDQLIPVFTVTETATEYLVSVRYGTRRDDSGDATGFLLGGVMYVLSKDGDVLRVVPGV